MSCPICGHEARHSFRPFCSKRCADLDLGRWLTGVYMLEGPPEQDIEAETDGCLADFAARDVSL